MPAGRPTKYNKSILDKSYDYLDNYFDKYKDQIPSVEGLSEVIDIARSTIYEWADQEDKKEFSDILEKINEAQARVLINNGINGSVNSAITKLVHG